MWPGNEAIGLLCNNHVGSHCVITASLLEPFSGDVYHLGLIQLLSLKVKVERRKKSLNPRDRRWREDQPRGRERCVGGGGGEGRGWLSYSVLTTDPKLEPWNLVTPLSGKKDREER